MKCNKLKSIKLPQALLDEFSECFSSNGRNGIIFTPEQDALIVSMMSNPGIHRRRFYIMFRKKYGIGSRESIQGRYKQLIEE